MRLSYAGRPAEAEAVRLIQEALDAGVGFLDTADVYCETSAEVGHNERLIRRALQDRDEDVLVATKGGHVRLPDGSIGRNGKPAAIRAACERSLMALGLDRIAVYYHHSPDPSVPIEESLGAISELQAEGKVAGVGVSNYNIAELERARTVVDVVAVQNRLSYADRESIAVMRHCEREGIAFCPWGVLGRSSTAIGSSTAVAGIAHDRGLSAQRVAVAWTLAQASCVIPIVGARAFVNLADCLAAPLLDLSEEELVLIERMDAPATRLTE